MIGSQNLNLLPVSGAYFPSQIPGPVTRSHGITPMAPMADRSSAFVSISPQPPSRFPTSWGTCLPLKSSPHAPASFLVLPSPNPCPHLPPPPPSSQSWIQLATLPPRCAWPPSSRSICLLLLSYVVYFWLRPFTSVDAHLS